MRRRSIHYYSVLSTTLKSIFSVYCEQHKSLAKQTVDSFVTFYGAKENEMDVSSNHLSHYLDQIHTFLINDGSKHVFLSLTMAMEDILVNIAKNANFLKNELFDDGCKSLAAQISAVLENNKYVFTLGYGFENDEFGKKVMVYTKKPVPEFMQPLGLKQLRKPHLPHLSQGSSNSKDSSNTKSLMCSFKTHCLNSTLKFVKNDAQLVLQYPDMSSEQVEFVQNMITQCLAPKDETDTGPGCQGMFDPLAEALRIFRLKYQFKLNSAVPMHDDMKRLCFEKIPKRSKFKKVDNVTLSNSSEESNIDKNNNASTSSENVNPNFVKETFFRIKEFLSNESEYQLTLPNLNVAESLRVMSWKKLVRTDTTDKELKQVMDEIRNIIEGPNETTVRTTLVRTRMMHRTVCLIKNITEHKQILMESSTTNLQTVTPLVDARKENKELYKNTLVNSVSVGNVKINTMELGNDGDVISNSSSNRSCNSESKEKKIDETTDNPNWLINTLTKLKEFINDGAQASLHLSRLTDQQVKSITCAWQNLSKNNDMYLPDVKMLLVEINRLSKNSPNFTVKFVKTSATKNQTRDIFFFKKPCFPALESKTKSEKPKEDADRAENAPAKSAPKVKAKKAKIVPTANINPATSYSSAKCIPKASSVTSLSVPKAWVKARPRSANVNSKVLKAKNKLIEALSQPLVSENGLKIMRNMGWEGGALGARGDGIVEPIMLPLDLAKRAGLGSLKLPLKLPNNAREQLPHNPGKGFKADILQTMANSIMSAQPATELKFTVELTLKDWSFVRHMVNSFNNRYNVSIDIPSLMKLCNTISDVITQTDYIITACWGVTKKNILFVLSKDINQLSDFDSKEWCSVVNFENIKKKVQAGRSDGHGITAGDTFRLYVMAIILDFCKKNPCKSEISKDVLLERAMAPKQLNYIKDVIQRLNNMSRASSNSDNEKALFDEIKMKIEGFVLRVEFPLLKSDDENEAPKVHKCIRLQKIFHPQHTTSSSPNPATCIFNIDKSLESINKKITNSQKIEDNIKVMDKNVQDIKKIFKNDKVVDQGAAMADQSAELDKMAEDCTSCGPDYVDLNTSSQSVEYIFIVEETFEIENAVTDRPTTEDEGSPHNSMITDKLHVCLQTLTINDHTPVNEQLECPEDNLRGFPEQNNISPSELDETLSDHSQISDYGTKEDDLNNATNKDIGKIIRSNAQSPERSIIIISITPNNYPQSEITHRMAGEIQKSILDSIDPAELPLLKCHGIQNGALVYSCHTRKSYNLIVNVVHSLDFHVCVMKERCDKRYKMSVRVNSYMDERTEAILDRLETYNISINTEDWKVNNVERRSNIIVMYIEIDEYSFNLISDNKFSLYAGTDDAKFSIVWD